MKKIYWTYLALTALIMATGFFVLTSSASNGKVEDAPTCCKKSMNKGMNDCQPVKKNTGNGDLIMESMSSQFISISAF